MFKGATNRSRALQRGWNLLAEIEKLKSFRHIKTVRITSRRIAAMSLAAICCLAGLHVHAGSPGAPLINEIRVQGNLRIEEDAIRLGIQSHEGRTFDGEVIARDVKAIFRMGFFDDVTVEFSPVGVLTYTVEEKPYIRQVEILGNVIMSTEDVEAALGMRPRTALDTGQLQAGLQRVLRLYSEAGHVNTRVDYSLTPEEHNQTIITLEVVEGKTLPIEKISFEGNSAFTDAELKEVMQTKEDWIIPFTSRGRLDPDILANDVSLLSQFYSDRGYIDHRVDEPIVLTRRKDLEVVIRVEEGERYRVGVVKVGGEIHGKPERLLERITLTSGQIFRQSRLLHDVGALRQRYADRGYAFAKVTPQAKRNADSRLVDVSFMIERGALVYFNQVKITGNVKTRDKVIRRELELAEKERFSSSRIRRGRENLLRSGFFKDVTVETAKTDNEDTIDLVVNVEEAPTGTFSVGAGYSTATSLSFETSLKERNLFGTGRGASLDLRLAKKRQDINLGLQEPRIFDSRFDVGLDLFHNTHEYTGWENRRTGFGANLSAPLRYVKLPFIGRHIDQMRQQDLDDDVEFSILDHLKGSIGYQLERNKIKDVLSTAPASIETGDSITSAVTPQVSYDTRNHYFFPTEGTVSVMSVKLAGVGGDNKFMRSDTKYIRYIPVFDDFEWGKGFTLMLGGRIGYAASWTQQKVPHYDRYFAGGPNSVRGFETRTLGPKECPEADPDCSDPSNIGGNKELMLRTELHIPIMDQQWGLKGLIFFDQGQAFGTSENIDLEDLKRSAGLGVKWLSPLGPIGVSWAVPINKKESDDPELMGFSLGNAGNF